MNEYIVGIDIGTSKICASVGKIDKRGELQIIGLTSTHCNGLKKGVVVDIDSTTESIRQCIMQLEKMTDISVTEAYISLPGGICELIWNKGVVAISSDDREITEKDVDRVLESAKLVKVPSDKEIIGVEPNQFIVDGYDAIKDPVGMSGYRLEVEAHVIVAQSTIVDNLIKSVLKANIKVKGIVLQPLAISEVVLRKEEIEMGTALIDIGAETIDISLYKNGNLCYTTMMPIGGNSITNDIAVCLKTPVDEAEKLKIKYVDLLKNENTNEDRLKVTDNYNDKIEVDRKMLNEIVKARIEELLYLVNKKIEESKYSSEISGVVLVGGGIALYRGIEEISKAIFKRSTRVGTAEFVGVSSPVYVTAVGIVKDVYENMNVQKEESAYDLFKEEKQYKNQQEKNENPKKEKRFVSKIRDFFEDFF